MKKYSLLLLPLALVASAHAGTYTWTGAAGDGLYFTAGNWNYDGAPAATSPGKSPADDIVMADAGTVEYVPGGDWEPKGTVTLSGNTTFRQTGGNAWFLIRGHVTVGNGATFDTGSSGQFRIAGTFTVAPGGTFVLTTQIANNGGTGVLELLGGTVTCTGEFKYTGLSFENEGADISCTLFAPQAQNIPATFSAGSLVCTGTGNQGFWHPAGSGIDVAAGSTAVFTMPVAAANVYSTYFTGNDPRFTYAGQPVSSADFDEIFTVEAVDASTARFFVTDAGSSYALSKPSVSGVTSSSATASATLNKVGDDPGTVVVSLATSVAAIDLEHGESLGAASTVGTIFSKTFTGLAEGTTYYVAFGILVGGEVVAQTKTQMFYASDHSAVFLDLEGDGQWTTAGNWVSGSVPTASDTILVAADCARSGNMNFSEWNVTVDGAAFAVAGEITTAARTIRNGALSATVFVGSGNAIEVRGSALTATTTGRWDGVPRGFYATAPFFNFHSGAACSYTYAYNPAGDPPDAADEFAALFTQGRILVDGAILSDASRVEITTNTTDHTMTATLLESAGTVAFADAAHAAVNGLSATLSVTVEVGGNLPLYVLVGTDPANLAATLVAAGAANATTYSFATNGVEGAVTYYRFRLGDGDGAIYDSLAPQSFFATANGNIWLGTVSSLASVPANWSKGAVPVAADAVYVIADKAARDLDWDLADATVASWKQVGDVSVTFQCTPSNLLSIAGNATLEGGTWTHTGPAAEPTTMINVSVGGDLVVGAGASIQAGAGADGMHTRPRGFTRATGPGYLRGAGASFAGDGGHPPSETSFVSYGSVLDPLSYGSGGWGDGNQYAGGGIVKLAVGGTLTVDGAIQSRGFGYPLDKEATIGGAGSGGSVNLTAGALAGAGRIDANGGQNGLRGPGSGGRVKIALTGASADFSDFTGVIEAIGGAMKEAGQANSYDITPAAAGTVCLSTAADTAPTVRVHNEFHYGNGPATWRVATDPDAVPSGTHLPAKQDTDAPAGLRHSRWELSGHGALRLTQNVRILSLSLASGDGSQCVYTDGHELFVKELTVAGETKHAGRYTAADLPNIVIGTGAVVVDSMPTILYVR